MSASQCDADSIAPQPEKLPWHRDEPDALLRRAVEARAARGRALDVGCGAGVFTVWLAQSGMETVGIDLFPEAITMARALLTGHVSTSNS